MAQRRVPTINDLRIKLCYICREEERHDAPEEPPRAWTHPCKCTLIAHESCLLQWIQTSQQNRSRAPNALKCPQCGSAYELQSDNPLILRILDGANRGLSTMGKIVTIASMYILSTAYGAYALKEFLGAEMYDLLLTEDPTNWPWHCYLNLPLIPLALIISRLPFNSSITPLVPLLLAWPTSTPARADKRILLNSWGIPESSRREMFPLLPSWPPPPVLLGLFIYPSLRLTYNRLFSQFSRWVLKLQPEATDTAQRMMLALEDDDPFLRIRINANGDERNGPPQPNAQGGAGVANNGANDNANADADGVVGDAAVAAENTIRVSGTSLGRLIGGALIIPRISSLMGSLLYRLSKYSPLLRRFLAVRPPLPPDIRPSLAGTWIDEELWHQMSPVKRLSVAGLMGLRVAWWGTPVWAECDPVWWRNSLGLGLFTVAKDCLHLLHLWLAKRELQSRRVKNRSFDGVDVRELDLIDPVP
ncbi:uncharacterized protein EDB91DRAFT_1106734 [Suillus paluster]|uniref:uncharacterized protein n=1 Tax=Suillus paluster TaxID=48578 RepID=UPI001B85CCCF|nr:uncharacterized protein EDB91DRAFT_1106734 [Suillus paluster]KAG1750338.1 hypothetical protein EDB91DRAFT_1106734 [Suillus paluster]